MSTDRVPPQFTPTLVVCLQGRGRCQRRNCARSPRARCDVSGGPYRQPFFSTSVTGPPDPSLNLLMTELDFKPVLDGT